MNWDDLKIFLAVNKAKSIRGAAKHLSMSHSTVSRRLNEFEHILGTQLFDKTIDGYMLSVAGEELLGIAENVESNIHDLHRTVTGRDQSPTGEIRISIPDIVALVFMQDFKTFLDMYPEIELDFLSTYELIDFSRREADIAIYCAINGDIPEYLVGRKLITYYSAAYASRKYLETHDLNGKNSNLRWLDWGSKGTRTWLKKVSYQDIPIKNKMRNAPFMLEAIKSGMGMGYAPCFMCDPCSEICRIPGSTPEPAYDMWILYHEDLRKTARLRLLVDFIVDAFERKKDLIEGRCPTSHFIPKLM